jgi:MFS superfamily sulfate permease-like transporter
MSFPSVAVSPTIAQPKFEPGLPMSTTATFIALRRSQLGHFREELWLPIALAYATLAGSPPQASIYGYLLGRLGFALLGSLPPVGKVRPGKYEFS